MEAQAQQIREQQRESWNKFSPGWKKWDQWVMYYLEPIGTEMVRYLRPDIDDIVLDVATGTGEPGITIAKIAKNGKVIGTDLSDGMLEVAKEHATQRGVTNYETQVADVCELPFEDNTFDLVSCRLGFMFFPDMQLAANEMARVLKPGGRMVTAVWGPKENNFWVTSLMHPIMKNLQLDPPPPDAPGMFRCAAPGLMTDLFKKAGLRNVQQFEVNSSREVESFETFWNHMNDVAAPIVAALSKADDAMKEKIKNEVAETYRNKFPGAVSFPLENQALIIYGEK